MQLLTGPIAWATGIPEPTLRLLLTLTFAYPVARFYNNTYVRGIHDNKAHQSSVGDRNNFILVAGLLLSFFFNGFHIYHSLLTIGVSYGFCYLGDQFHNRQLATMGVWVFNAAYLLLGYYFTATDEYDISWTMTQCVLCLRLMGFGFDFLDGEEKKVEGTGDSKAAPMPLSFANPSLKELPEFTEMLAYCLFPSAFLIGPQFSFALYKRWLTAPYNNKPVTEWEEIQKYQMMYVIRCVTLGVIYLAVQQVIGAQYSTAYLLTDEYAALPIYKRFFVFWMAGKFCYNKYLGVWMLTEGASAYFGISYEGEDADGRSLFTGLANVLPAIYERATSIDHVIGSFNINTNLWVKYYVFKRLRFLGNKNISQFASLAFLAIWHGFHFNYFTTFLLEFLDTLCESILRKRLVPLAEPYIKTNVVSQYAWKALVWLACSTVLNYGIIGFDLLKTHKAWVAYKSVYFLGHIAVAVILGGNWYLGKTALAKKGLKTN
ncbi:hypothetical protein DFQ28_001116 [Apophysomyces sp. BC1034]|nr:hypothetical protein DFQ30_001772 [Apophysomyces sp. BC1015]KAG0166804.1 hypothetical protein DFQ29_000787 [Apophysomyces sp. BC1021]KAG0183732.1 hypothetical protein DFQ28_001116 [Apophysomyces sp. BC1034]